MGARETLRSIETIGTLIVSGGIFIRWLCVCVAAWLLLAAPAHADATADSVAAIHAAGDSVLVLPEVRVDRDRAGSDLRSRPPTTFVSQLATSRPGHAAQSVGETLAEAAGVRVLQYGGLGAFSTVSMRGTPASQTALLMDGEPLQSAARSTVSLSDVPAEAVERIEVFRGAAPLAFGMPSPAGAVNLVTLPDLQGIDARVARGSYDTWEGRVRGGGARGPVAVALNAGYQGSRGDYRFFDDNGTPFNSADDSITTRINNRYDASHALGSLTWSMLQGVRLRVRETWFRAAQGVPGLGVVQAATARHTLERSTSRLELERDAARAWPALRLDGSLRRERARFRDLQGELGLGRWSTDDRFAGERGGAELAWPAVPLGRTFSATPWEASIRGSGDVRSDRAQPTNAAGAYADPPRSVRAAHGAALALELRAPGGRGTLYAARRWDRVTDRLHGLTTFGTPRAIDVTRETASPQLGARVALRYGLEARGNWTDAVRLPDFSELFGDAGNVYGNLQLVPERTRSWDAGLALRRTFGAAAARAEWAHFRTRADDLILFLPAGPGVKAMNVDRARIAGDELEVEAGPLAALTLWLSWTRQSATDASLTGPWSGKRLPALPGTQLDARVSFTRGAFGGYAGVFHLGPNDLDRYNRMHVPARTLSSAGITWSPAPALHVTLEGRNLGDVRATDVAGFPLPGRMLSVAVDTQRPRSHP